MAKKKSKKKDSDKKKSEKKKLLKLKLKSTKRSKKKEAKKKEAKKKKRKSAEKKKEAKKKQDKTKEGKKKPKVAIKHDADHSSNYNATDAISKLRAQKSKEQLLAFTKGETRLTVIRVIPAALNKLEK